MEKINYILIPRDIIEEKSLGKNRINVYSYFASKRGLDDTVGFSCDSIVQWCGYKVNYRKDKINSTFTTLLEKFIKMEYIETIGTINRNDYLSAKLNIEKFDTPSGFALIYLDEINTIKNFRNTINDNDIKSSKISASILLLLLAYIRVNLLRRHKDYIGKLSDKPEFCYRMYKGIEEDIGISSRYISKGISILSELNIIATKVMPRYRDDTGNWHTEVTLFANKYKRKDSGYSIDENYDHLQELSWGEEYIAKKKFLNKKFNQETEKSKIKGEYRK